MDEKFLRDTAERGSGVRLRYIRRVPPLRPPDPPLSDGVVTLRGFVEAEGGALVGSVGLHIRKDGRGEIGYLVARWARRRGVATRALRLLAAFAFDALGIARLEVLVRPENEPSMAVAERVGFTREGTLRSYFEGRGERHDAVMLSLLPGELR